MSTQDWAVWLVSAAALPATIFPVLYAAIAPWWRTVIGRSLMIGELSLALLLDVALIVHWQHWILPSWVALILYGLIAVGCWMRLGALIQQQIVERPDH